MKTSDFDYALPPELIAQNPLPERSQSRMLVLPRQGGALQHRQVVDVVDILDAGDLLVVNDTQVFPARIHGQRTDTGGQAELLLTHRVEGGPQGETWEALMKSGFRARAGIRLRMAEGAVNAEILETMAAGRVKVRLESETPLHDILEHHGEVPLPPYIRRTGTDDARADIDRTRYQTVYATSRGAVAAPTAGLHFSDALLADLEAKGIGRATVTLHVGPGTFRPVKADDVSGHEMDAEWYALSEETAARIRATRAAGGRVVAVGTTTVRTLETVCAEYGEVVAASGWSRLFIHPPYRFGAVDALLTNFHLPRSTLLMLVSAFCDGPQGGGRERLLETYRCAVAAKYRFYSYGDCMMIV
ncbi:MAG: tRNA preQ1(34) S-adenosylmethionine ribosyltransferase-isomerase QueA [Verrucomicrobia bacterium]|jgi:S-adenosylmethionine:tRNA ribosyltransferase-isomerase|nr:tRNA preQ1(34) S-adenosylmethionine ribosyltransferase-isomerase QueA [Verrucomicrobiota bacterium]